MGSAFMEPYDIETYALIYNPKENHSSICLSTGKIQSRGVFHGSNPLDYSVPLLLAQLFVASIFILCASRLLKPLGLPSMVIQILGGLALGPSFLGRFSRFTEVVYPLRGLVLVDSLASFGYMLCFFLIGVQIDPGILKKIEKKEVSIGISTVTLALVLSISTSIILPRGAGIQVAANIASSLPVVAAASSVLGFPIIAYYLTELKMANSDFGRMALLSSMVSNAFGICIIFLTTVFKESTGDQFSMMGTTCSGIGLAVVIVFVIRPIILWFMRRNAEGEPLKQNFLYMVFVGIFMMGFCSKALGLHIYYGPLVYGMAIPAGPPLGSALVEKLDFVNSWLFMPLYFVKNGLVTDVFSVKLKNYVVVQSIILVACMGKFLGALSSAVYNGVPLRDAISVGLVVNFQGVLELGMFKMMKQSKAIDNEVFAVLCSSMLIVTAVVTPILRHLYDPRRKYAVYKRRTVLDAKPDSELQVLACIHDQHNVCTTVNLFEVLHPTKRSPLDVCVLHLVELVGLSHPDLIPHKLTRKNSNKASTSKSFVKAFTLFQQVYHGVVTLHPFTAISPYVSMHDLVCTMALEWNTSLIILPFHKRLISNKVVASLKNDVKIMNSNILEMAPCSVAILVDRGLEKSSSTVLETWTSYRIAVLFLGGPDDREALAMGARMVGQPNTSLTIFRLLENGSINANHHHATQRELDNESVSSFRYFMAGNRRVTYVQEEVSDGTGTVGMSRSMENQYDLIIVGRRHDTRSPLMLGLSDWNEDSYLGSIGDLFASEDFESKSTILVVQQHSNVLGEWDGNKKN